MSSIIFVLFLLAPPSRASSFFIYEGYLTEPDGSPVGSIHAEDVPFILKIQGKNSIESTTCELYREERTVQVRQGQFSIPVGNGSGATITAPSGMTFAKIFGNANLVGQESCLFEPEKTGAYRDLSIEIKREGAWIELGSVVLGESPRAGVAGTAEKLGEFQSGNFLRVTNNGVPQSLGAWSPVNYAKLVDLVSSTQVSGSAVSITGTSSGFTGTLGGDVIGAQSATKVTALQGYPVGAVAPSNGQTLVWSTAQNRWQPGAFPTQLPPSGAAGGDLSGAYPNPALKAGGVTYDKLSSGTAADQVLQFNGTNWTASKLKYTSLSNHFNASPWPTSDCSANEALSWSSISDSFVCRAVSISPADGSVGRAQIADNAVNDAKIADVLVDKVSNGMGKYFKYAPNGVVCTTGQTLKWTNNRWECGNDSIGLGIESDPTVLSFAKNNPSTDFTTPSGILTLNAGTGANQILKLNASAQIPAVSGLLLTNLNAGNLATGTVSVARLGSGTANNTTFLRGDGTWAAVSGSGLTTLNGQSGTNQTFSTPGTAGNAPNWASSSNAHTLHIPMASATGVTAGLLSKAQYDVFNGKQAAGSYITALSGDVVATGPGSAAATISAGAVTTAKIADAAVTDAKIGGMSAGKLTGTISVARLPALNGDVTSAVGTATVTVAKIRGKTIASAAPADGQVLTWNDTNGQWEPKTPSGGGGGTLACPGMILVPADLANGKGAFCISAEKPATSYTAMTDTCYSEDGELCSAAEMRRYCKSSGTLSFSAVWTSTVSGVVSGSPKVYKISCSGGSPSGAFSYSIAEISSTVYFRCCRR